VGSLSEAQALQPLRARFQPGGFIGLQAGGEASLSHFLKIDRIPYFDIPYSLFDIRYSLFQSFFFDQTGRFSGQRRCLYPAFFAVMKTVGRLT